MEQIIQILTDKYGPVTRLTGGFTNLTFLLETTPLLVAKVASLSNQDVLNEGNVLRYLSGNPISPRFVELMDIGLCLVLVTTFEQGLNGQGILDTGDMESSRYLFHHMGISLARDIHSITYSNRVGNLRHGKIKKDVIEFVPEGMLKKLCHYLQAIDMNPSSWVFTHGDYGSHNILFDENSNVKVIDWEWAEWFHPLVDIAWTCWNTKLHYPKMADELNQIFIKAYQSVRPIHLDDQLIKSYALYKLSHILHKVQNVDTPTQEKWLKRLEWTFQTNII